MADGMLGSEEIDFVQEAREVIRDVGFAVKSMFLSEVLESDHNKAFINLTTREEKEYCIELNKQGFQIVGSKHDDCTDSAPDRQSFETVYSLLDTISPSYVSEFGNQLVKKLERIQNGEPVCNGEIPEAAE